MTNWKYEITEAIIVVVTMSLLFYFADDKTFSAIIFAISAGFCIYGAYSQKNLEINIQWHWLILSAAAGVVAYFFYATAFIFFAFYAAMRFAISILRRGEAEDILRSLNDLETKHQTEIEKIKSETFAVEQKEISRLQQDMVYQKTQYEKMLVEVRESLLKVQQEKISEVESAYLRRQQELKNILSQNQKTLAEKQAEFEREKINAISVIKAETESRIKNLTDRLNDQDEYIVSLETKNMQSQTELNSLKNQYSQSQNKIFVNSELHNLLIETLKNADTEVDIMSPWVSKSIFNADLRGLVRLLLKIGVIVKIAYGIGNNNYKNGRERNENTERLVAELKNDFYTFPNFKTKKISSHGKIFICDEKYYVLTSLNPLSNDGSSWDEIGEQSFNKENLLRYRKKYFDF